MSSFLSSEFLTQVGHTIIILGVAAAYGKANQAKNLVEIQKDTIETLQKGFDACKERLAEVEKAVGKNNVRRD